MAKLIVVLYTFPLESRIAWNARLCGRIYVIAYLLVLLFEAPHESTLHVSSLVWITALILRGGGSLFRRGVGHHSFELLITLIQPESELIDSSSAILNG